MIVVEEGGQFQEWCSRSLHLALALFKVHIIAQQPHDLLGPSRPRTRIRHQPDVVLSHGKRQDLIAHVTELFRQDYIAGMHFDETVILLEQLVEAVARTVVDGRKGHFHCRVNFTFFEHVFPAADFLHK